MTRPPGYYSGADDFDWGVTRADLARAVLGDWEPLDEPPTPAFRPPPPAPITDPWQLDGYDDEEHR